KVGQVRPDSSGGLSEQRDEHTQRHVNSVNGATGNCFTAGGFRPDDLRDLRKLRARGITDAVLYRVLNKSVWLSHPSPKFRWAFRYDEGTRLRHTNVGAASGNRTRVSCLGSTGIATIRWP